MKKLTVILLMIVATVALSFAFVGCSQPKQPQAQDVFNTDDFVFTKNKSSSAVVSYTAAPTSKTKEAQKVTVPGDIYGYRVTTVANNAFKGVTSLKEVVISENVTIIDSSAFYGCTSLTSVTLPETLGSIQANAFRGCSALQSITFPDSVRAIAENAFSDCTSLVSFNIPGNLKSISDYSFSNTAVRKIEIPEGVKKIGVYAFSGCKQLSEVKLPQSLEIVGSYAFYGDTALTGILFPRNEMLRLGAYAFAYSGLLTVYLPENVVLGEYTFMKLAWDESVENPGEPASPGVSGCTAVYYESAEGSLGTNAFGYTWNRPDLGFRIYIPKGSMQYYTNPIGVDESWYRCVVNSVNSNSGEFNVLQEYDIAEVFPDGFPVAK
ncbi:MAG: leucine-rich repeat domain-containing protein [Candidatus Neoclostridium sp.]